MHEKRITRQTNKYSCIGYGKAKRNAPTKVRSKCACLRQLQDEWMSFTTIDFPSSRRCRHAATSGPLEAPRRPAGQLVGVGGAGVLHYLPNAAIGYRITSTRTIPRACVRRPARSTHMVPLRPSPFDLRACGAETVTLWDLRVVTWLTRRTERWRWRTRVVPLALECSFSFAHEWRH